MAGIVLDVVTTASLLASSATAAARPSQLALELVVTEYKIRAAK